MKKAAMPSSLNFTDRVSVIFEPKHQKGTAGSTVVLPAVPFFLSGFVFYFIRLSRMPIALLDWLTPMLCTRMTSEAPYCSASLLTVV